MSLSISSLSNSTFESSIESQPLTSMPDLTVTDPSGHATFSAYGLPTGVKLDPEGDFSGNPVAGTSATARTRSQLSRLTATVAVTSRRSSGP